MKAETSNVSFSTGDTFIDGTGGLYSQPGASTLEALILTKPMRVGGNALRLFIFTVVGEDD